MNRFFRLFDAALRRRSAPLAVAVACAIALATWFSWPVHAQRTAANPFGAQLNVQDAGTCSTVGSFAWQTLPTNSGTTSLNLSGTFVATVTVRQSNNGGGSWFTVGTFSAPATAVFATNGFTDFCADVTSFTSGIVQVAIDTGIAASGASGSTFTNSFTPAVAQSSPGSLQTPITSSATGAASAITCTLPAAAGKFTYITGFQVTGGGATAGSIVVVTLTGTVTGTQSFDVAPPTGAAVGMSALVVSFPVAVPSSAINTAIVVNVPSLGAGNTNSACSAQGFQQ